jgi:hypothetical protein
MTRLTRRTTEGQEWKTWEYLALDLQFEVVAWGHHPEAARSRAVARGMHHPMVVYGYDYLRARV